MIQPHPNQKLYPSEHKFNERIKIGCKTLLPANPLEDKGLLNQAKFEVNIMLTQLNGNKTHSL